MKKLPHRRKKVREISWQKQVKKKRAENKRRFKQKKNCRGSKQNVARRVIIETSSYVQVVVTFVHKNAKLAYKHAHDVVKCCQESGQRQAKPKR